MLYLTMNSKKGISMNKNIILIFVVGFMSLSFSNKISYLDLIYILIMLIYFIKMVLKKGKV